MYRLYGKFATYLRRVLCNTRLIFPRINGPIVRLANRVAVWRQSEVLIYFRKVLGHEVFSPDRSLNQPKATGFCILSISQSNRSIFVRLLFLFCSRVFISRSYENRSNRFCLPPKFCISYCLQMLLGKCSTQLPEAALYPDVSLSRWKFARKGGREEEKRASPPFYSLPMVTCALSPVTRVSRSPLGCKIMRKTKRLKRRQSQEHLKTVVYALFGWANSVLWGIRK